MEYTSALTTCRGDGKVYRQQRFYLHTAKSLSWVRTPITELRRYYNVEEPVYNKFHKRDLNVHVNQFNTAKEILSFFENGVRDVILTADMQSGKTGTVRYVLYAMQHLSSECEWWNDLMVPENMYFICGMNDNDLRSQAIREFKGLLPAENILFSAQLQAFNKTSDLENTCSLIVVDESHYASRIDSQVDQFLDSLSDQRPYVLSVSATAMAELATSQHYGKAIVRLHPGKGYYGVSDLFSRGLVFQAASIVTELREFSDIVWDEYMRQRRARSWKYNLVRLPSHLYNFDVCKQLRKNIGCDELNIAFVNLHSELYPIDDFNNLVGKRPPKQFTIVWIYGTLRAGKQLNTRHIGFVHDTAKSSPDTIAQSLLGRILGYGGKERHNVRCYTDMNAATLIRDWLECSFDMAMIPAGSRSIRNGRRTRGEEWSHHVPIAITLPVGMAADLKFKHNQKYPYKARVFEQLSELDSSGKLRHIFETYKPGKCGGLMILDETNTVRSYYDNWTRTYNRFKRGLPCSGHYAKHGEVTSFYVYINLHRYSSFYGIALVTYKELTQDGSKNEVLVKPSSRFSLEKQKQKLQQDPTTTVSDQS